MFSEVIKLLSITKVRNAAGDLIPKTVPREIYADKKSVRQSEVYQAAALDLKPEIVFEVWEFEYQDEEELEFEEKKYKIIRTYSPPKKRDHLELVCEKVP